MMKYTQGPWAVFPRGGQVYIGVGKDTGDGILDAGFGVWGGGVERRDNAERIVACVNAMAGINDPVHAMSVLREGLAFIRDAHIPDQPAAAAGDELAWAQRHVAKLRSEARALLSRMGGGE